MSVTNVSKDLANHTMVVSAEFNASIERVWQLWADPRQLERWWGPPVYPATVEQHDLTAGGRVTYYMTGPEGDRHAGFWDVLCVDPPRLLDVQDGFADADGNPNPDLPFTKMTVTLAERPAGGTAVTIASVFPSVEAMKQLIAMGMEEGLQAAMSQMDAIVAEPAQA